jgi:hypothetical protein
LFGGDKNAVTPVSATIKARPEKSGTARKAILGEGETTTSLCLFIRITTKQVAASKITHQNTTNQPNAIKLNALKISVMTVMDTPHRRATNKKHSRKDTAKEFVFEGAQVRFISFFLSTVEPLIQISE